MTAPTRRAITDEDVQRSYDLVALLEVCKGAAEHVSEQTPPHHEMIQLIGAIPSTIQQAIDKWSAVHDALEGAERAQEKVEPSQEPQP